VGSGLAGPGCRVATVGPVALCTLGLGLLSPPSLNGRYIEYQPVCWGKGGVCSLVSGGR